MMDIQINSTNYAMHNSTSTAFSSSEIGMIYLMAILFILLIGSTLYDLLSSRIMEKEIGHKMHSLLKSFSLYTNGKNLLNTYTDPRIMTCMYGLRFLSMFWIILCHTYYMKSIGPIINNDALKKYDNNVGGMLLMNATVTTDTFFLLSGTLVCYVYLHGWNKNNRLNILKFYLVRYIRLTPPYAFVIFFYATLMYRLGSGPLWDMQMGHNRDHCVENWWTNLLYINNYLRVDRMCMNQTWYLAVNMQLFWFSPLILYPLAKWPRTGKIFLGVAVLVSIMIPILITCRLHLAPLMLYTKDQDSVGSVYVQIYTRAYARAGPFLIGIALASLMHFFEGKEIYIPRKYVFLGWLVSVTSCLAVVLGAVVFYDDNHEYNSLESGVYAGLHRPVWALSIAWIIFACVKGYGGPMNTFLSWRLFIPLSRLTYCAYLCHYIFLLYNFGSLRTWIYLSEYNTIHDFAGNLVFSYITAAILSLAIEIPFINLGDAVLRKVHDSSRNDSVGTTSTCTSLWQRYLVK